jgi:hypothetical protein
MLDALSNLQDAELFIRAKVHDLSKPDGVRKLGAGDGTRTHNFQLGKLMRYRCATPAR